MTSQPTPANWLSIAALGLIWGATFMVVAIALEGYGPLTVACARTTLGAVALLLLMRVLNRPLPVFTPVMIRYLVAIGLMNTALPFALLSWGQQYVPSAFAGISMAALPLFVLPLAHLFTDEKMSLRNTLGVMMGFIGATVLIGPGVLRIGTGWEPLGQIACVAASVSYAVSSIMTRRCPPIDPITMAALLLTVGSVALIPAMLIVEGVPDRWRRAPDDCDHFPWLHTNSAGCPHPGRHDPISGCHLHDAGKLSGAALVDVLWRAGPK